LQAQQAFHAFKHNYNYNESNENHQ
jgi:hypothetical protein